MTSKIVKAAGALMMAVIMGSVAAPAMAEEGVRGKQAGDLVIGLSAIGVLPEDGGGLNYTFFFGHSHGNVNPAVRSVAVNGSLGFALNAGLDVELSGPWALNFAVKQIFLSPNAAVGTNIPGVKIHAKTELNPLVVGMGVRYRFLL
jgi:outer membrane protein W